MTVRGVPYSAATWARLGLRIAEIEHRRMREHLADTRKQNGVEYVHMGETVADIAAEECARCDGTGRLECWNTHTACICGFSEPCPDCQAARSGVSTAPDLDGTP